METALGAANWLLGKLLNKLSGDLVAGYVASSELGLNFDKIKTDLNFTLGLLHAAQGRDVSNNPGLQRLLEDLSSKADEADDALDELEYFMIQDELDGTREAAPDLGDRLAAQALHARHAARNTVGNWLSYFSCYHSQDADAAITNKTQVTSKAKSDSMNINGGCGDKLPFDRVAMSNKIKQLIEDMHSKCCPVSDLLKINSSNTLQSNMLITTARSHTSSEITQQKLFGRDTIFKKTMTEMINATHKGEILSILPIVGPGGIGKTTFTQHLYNDKRTEDHFAVRVWVCVSTSFDVLKLTKEILSCLPAIKNNEENEIGNGTTNNLDQLQKSIARRLKSIRFLIVLDDIWECSSNDEWEKLLAPFNKGEVNGSMVLVTTRFPKIVQMVRRETHPIHLNGLEPNEFWKFFQLCVFGRIQDEHDNEDLIETARKISAKLKCSPLAAKTVGRLLSKKPSRGHWMEILEKDEWLKQEHSSDIIPALKISYDYLPFHLKKCFSYCALYPEDYKFDSSEISHFWSSIGIIDTSRQNDKIEHIGSNYLDELVDSGFLMKEDDYYVMHDLMHELSQSVSSKECAYINCSNFSAEDIPSSVHHISIYMKRNYTQRFEQEMNKLKRRINTGNLRSLMFFGDYRMERTINILKYTFKDIKSLRVLFIFMNSLDSLPQNFSKLVHLRYLKISSRFKSEVYLPTTISSFYHLKFLDLSNCNYYTKLPKNIARLCNLRYFLGNSRFHSNVPEVGKMKHLQELKKFCVKKESVGFELTELGSLTELWEELSICNLEKVKTKEEATEARLIEKRNLNKLRLVWDKEQQYLGADDVLDGFQPHSSLRSLCIVNPVTSIGPNWLCDDIYIKNLESLHLESVSWVTLPPFGQIPHLRKLKLKSIVGLSQLNLNFSCEFTEKSFSPLKSILLNDMPDLVEWVGDENCLLFPLLERVECVDCPVLSALPILGCPRHSTQDLNTPNLQSLHIIRCPNLSLPPMPHTSSLRNIHLDNQTMGNFREQLYLSQTWLSIKGYKGDLAIHHIGKVECMDFTNAPHVSLVDLQRLNSLRSLSLCRFIDTIYKELDDSVVLRYVESLSLKEFSLTSKLLSNLFKCFPALSDLSFINSNEEKEEVVLQLPSSCSLRKFVAESCKNLLLPSVEDEGALMDLTSLQVFEAWSCGRIFSRWSVKEPTQIINPFPASLKELHIEEETSMQSMGLLSNLTSLTNLEVLDCDKLKMDGFNPLMVCNNLRRFRVTGCGSVAADLLSEVARTKTLPAGAFRLESLVVDSISAVLVAPICSRLTATLNRLHFYHDKQTEGFTEEQEQAIQLLQSLQVLLLYGCEDVRSLPEGLHFLLSLRELGIHNCPKLRSLPKKALPASLEEVYISGCSIEFETGLRETGLPIFKLR